LKEATLNSSAHVSASLLSGLNEEHVSTSTTNHYILTRTVY